MAISDSLATNSPFLLQSTKQLQARRKDPKNTNPPEASQTKCDKTGGENPEFVCPNVTEISSIRNSVLVVSTAGTRLGLTFMYTPIITVRDAD